MDYQTVLEKKRRAHKTSGFKTDTLVDYNEEGAETKWKWYYPTATIHDQTPSPIR